MVGNQLIVHEYKTSLENGREGVPHYTKMEEFGHEFKLVLLFLVDHLLIK